MPQSGYTPIQIYSSSTPTNAPSAGNLTNDTKGSELAINIADKNLFFKDSSNIVNTVPIRQSGAASDGWLSSTDWNIFNNKAPAGAYLTSVTADSPLSGAGTSASHLVIAQATTSTSGYLSSTDWNTFNNKQPAGTYVTSVTGTAPVVSSGGTTPAISMAAATTSVNGYLTSTDWNTFNGKQAALVSGTNIKTVSGTTLLGSGDLGTIGTGYGGTGLTSFTNKGVLYASSTSALTTSSALQFDGSNLGVGVTPSAWASIYKAIQFGTVSSVMDTGTSTRLYNNAYVDNGGTSRYLTTAAASTFQQVAGNFYWYQAPSGTAGDPISFTQAMTLFASGGLSLGNTTDPGAKCLSLTSAGTSSATTALVSTNSGGTELMFIRSDGAFRTGSAAASPYNNTIAAPANAYINTDGTLLRAISSRKYKRDIQDAVHGLADVLKLRPVTYKGKNEVDGETIYGGLIAEEVHDIGLTEFVQYNAEGEPDALHYSTMVSLAFKAIQQLEARIKELESK